MKSRILAILITASITFPVFKQLLVARPRIVVTGKPKSRIVTTKPQPQPQPDYTPTTRFIGHDIITP